MVETDMLTMIVYIYFYTSYWMHVSTFNIIIYICTTFVSECINNVFSHELCHICISMCAGLHSTLEQIACPIHIRLARKWK